MRIVRLWALMVSCSCAGSLRVDDLVKEGQRNEVSAIRTARGKGVEAAGVIRNVLPPRSNEPQRAEIKGVDDAHSWSIDLVTADGTPTLCSLAPEELGERFKAGERVRLVGRFSDFLQDSEGKWSVVMKRCRATRE